MDANGLKTVQAPLKARYREEPEAALITLRAAGRSPRPASIRRRAAPRQISVPATCCFRRSSPVRASR
jgi:hypothetical protein